MNAALAIILVGAFLAGPALAQGAHETKDRLTAEGLRALVAEPLAKVEAGDLAGGRAAFDALLAQRAQLYGAGSVQVADSLTAFGVLLYNDDCGACGRVVKEAAAPYLRQAVEAKRSAFGADSPELALSLNDSADVEWGLNRASPPLWVDEALAQAYRIRLASLGPNNAETATTLARLYELEGLPMRARLDASDIDRVAGEFGDAIKAAEARRADKPGEPALAYGVLARFYERHGQLSKALAAFDRQRNACRDYVGTRSSCGDDVRRAEEAFSDLLERDGYHAAADKVSERLAKEVSR